MRERTRGSGWTDESVELLEEQPLLFGERGTGGDDSPARQQPHHVDPAASAALTQPDMEQERRKAGTRPPLPRQEVFVSKLPAVQVPP